MSRGGQGRARRTAWSHDGSRRLGDVVILHLSIAHRTLSGVVIFIVTTVRQVQEKLRQLRFAFLPRDRDEAKRWES